LTRPEVLIGILGGARAVVPNLCDMARPARHKIELGDEERSELERIARAEKRPWREVQRARIVLYAADGKRRRDRGSARHLGWDRRSLAKALL
jgi:hypothetical protein